MAFSYTTGTPSNVAAPNAALMDDIKGGFTDIADYVNGDMLGANISSVGDASLASPNSAVWKPVYSCYGQYGGQTSLTTTAQFANSALRNGVSVGGTGAGVNNIWTCPTFSNIQVAEYTTHLRLRVIYITNATAIGVVTNVSLYPITASGGGAGVIGVASVGSPLGTATIASSASTAGQSVGSTMALSSLTAGTSYLVGVATASGSAAVNSTICCNMYLEMNQS